MTVLATRVKTLSFVKDDGEHAFLNRNLKPYGKMPSMESSGFFTGLETPTVTQLIRVFFCPGKHLVSIPSHLHHFFQLDIVLGGVVDIALEKQPTFQAERGTAVLIPPLVKHSYESAGGVCNCSFKFHLSFSYWSIFAKKHVAVRLKNPLLNMVESAINEIAPEKPFSRDRAVSLITLCLLEMAPGEKAAGPISEGLDTFRKRLWPLLDNIASRPYDNWTISGLANDCHINVDYFTKCFHELLGMPPQQYLLETRMRRAAEDLLFKLEMPIKEIAEEAGYASVHSFTRAFVHVFDMGPATYRRHVDKF